jgi:RNA polymerase sigma-70 factor (ECF subfamily)
MNIGSKYEDEFILLQAVKANDLHAFRSLYDIYYHQLFNYASRILNDPEQAEDIISESFVIIWQKKDKFQSLKALAAYLYVVTRNACFEHLKKIKRLSHSQKEAEYILTQPGLYEAVDAVKADLIQFSLIAAQKLPKEMQKVFQLIYIEGFSVSEAADRLQLSIHTVKAQKVNAIKRVRETLIKKGLLMVFC